jgi:hypothetical protein
VIEDWLAAGCPPVQQTGQERIESIHRSPSPIPKKGTFRNER